MVRLGPGDGMAKRGTDVSGHIIQSMVSRPLASYIFLYFIVDFLIRSGEKAHNTMPKLILFVTLLAYAPFPDHNKKKPQ